MTLKTKREGLDTSIDPATGQQREYLVLSEKDRAQGFVRPVRHSYVHIGAPGPRFRLRKLTDEERERYSSYVGFEEYPASEAPKTGRFWTQEELDRVGKGCGTTTTMSGPLAETYALDPHFYSGTFCAGCKGHFPVGTDGEFVWRGTDQRVGT